MFTYIYHMYTTALFTPVSFYALGDTIMIYSPLRAIVCIYSCFAQHESLPISQIFLSDPNTSIFVLLYLFWKKQKTKHQPEIPVAEA